MELGLAALIHGRTTFVIAHRLSTIRGADQILILEDGKILERGNHNELMVLGGRYLELYTRQVDLEANRLINRGEDDSLDSRNEGAPEQDSSREEESVRSVRVFGTRSD